MEEHDLLSNDLLINNASQANLISSAKWGKFLAIVGFVSCVLLLLLGIYWQMAMPSYAYEYRAVPKYLGITYAVMAIILFFPCLYLLKFSNKIQEAVAISNQESLDDAFVNLKSMFRFYGIFTIVILIFFVVAILGGIGSIVG